MPTERASKPKRQWSLPKRRQRAAKAAYAGGFLLFLSGSAGSAALIGVGFSAVREHAPRLSPAILPLIYAAAIIVALGGLSVMVGGWLLQHKSRIGGKVVIALGAGSGLILFVFNFAVVLIAGNNPLLVVFTMGTTIQGVGVLLALYAQAIG